MRFVRRKPFTRDRLEGIRAFVDSPYPLSLAVMRWVDLRRHQLASPIALLSCRCQGDLGITPDREHILFAADPISVTPEARASRSYLEMEPIAISEFVGLAAGLCGPYAGIAQAGVDSGSHDTHNDTRIPLGFLGTLCV